MVPVRRVCPGQGFSLPLSLAHPRRIFFSRSPRLPLRIGAIMQSVESLESRRLLSAPSVTMTSKGTLIVAGTTSADHVTITRSHPEDPNSALDISITGGSANTSAHAHKRVSEFQRISIDLGTGADSVSFVIPGKLKQPTTILGGAGDDM